MLPVIVLVAIALSVGVYAQMGRGLKHETNQVKSVHQTQTKAASVEKPVTLDTFSSIIADDKDSVVKIKGIGCGYEFTGTGFVVAPDLVATNAHAIAGVVTPHVIDSNGDHIATPVIFNTKLDFAVLRVDGLAGKPLNLDSSGFGVAGLHNGNHDVMLGYPGGSDFAAGLAEIDDEIPAELKGAFDDKPDNVQDIYEISANVVQGNSGSPLIQQDGLVAGIVFGTSPTAQNSGYALPTNQFLSAVQQAKSLHDPVDTQACRADIGE